MYDCSVAVGDGIIVWIADSARQERFECVVDEVCIE